MSVSIINPGVSGITVETDPTALKLTGGAITGDLTVAQKVGIGGVVPVGATNKLAVHNGNIVFTSGYGLAFGDGSTLISGSNIPRTNISNSFTLKQVFNTASGVAGLNIGIGGTDTASNVAGDMWIPTGGQTLNYRDANNSWRQVLTTTTIGLITVSSTSPALRLTQTGTGHALLVEDSSNPDSTPFVVTNNGQTVIGGLTPYSTASLTVNGGASIESGSYYVRVDSNGVGIWGTLVLTNQTTVSGTTIFSDYNNDLAVSVNGQTIYIPYRV